MKVRCRCGWEGEDAQLTKVMLSQDLQCPQCGAAFQSPPPLRLRRGKDPKAAIAAELYDILLNRLDAPPELLSIIGSWGDSLPDEQVLVYLRDWNESGKVIHGRQ